MQENEGDGGAGGSEGDGPPEHDRGPVDRPDKPERAEKERPIEASDGNRAGRAVAEPRELNSIERACGAVEKVVEQLQEHGLLGFEPSTKGSKQVQDSLGNAGPQPGERISEWVGQDAVGDQSQVKEGSKGPLGDFIAGVDDFCKNYTEMTSKKSSSPDKFFHCQANCEATQRGPGGELAAKTISYGREAIDVVKNVIRTKDPLSVSESIKDCRQDLGANRIGREAGRNGVRCFDACKRDWTREF